MGTINRNYYVYQCHMSGKETLYKSGLTDLEANRAWDELDNMIANGGCGDGCAIIGSLDEKSDIFVAKRLGLIQAK